ncbi:MAG TPA: hypothetical protein DHW82_00260 [Spirochaetia bacterium]|nr:MAG: hypothetical protein A2Y41_00880 [Spirochaetes bacterium GWB1_36_13]HCL55434.1 hypothetical protein [Spirochaetia bacterium]
MKKIFGIVFLAFLTQSVFSIDIKLVFMTGKVEYKLSSENFWKPAAVNMKLTENDSIRTGKSSLAIINIGDSLVLRISQISTIYLKQLTNQTEVDLKTGKIWAKVSKKEDNQLIRFASPTTVVGVRGTEFIYESTESEDQVLVLSGTVEFGKKEGEKVAVETGKIGILKQKKTVEVKIAPADKVQELKESFTIDLSKLKIPFIDAGFEELLKK